jgi:hypothetical protein
MVVLILLTVVIPFFLLKEITGNFKTIQTNRGFWLSLLFVVGVYFYATGNGLHEVSSFNFNNFCDTGNFSGDLCGGFFINDYYTGNILYFIGGGMMVIALMLLERLLPNKNFNKKDFRILFINALVYSLAIFAYAAFDRVLVGIIYSVIITLISIYLFWKIKSKYLQYPVITYTTFTYLMGTLLALFVRIIK